MQLDWSHFINIIEGFYNQYTISKIYAKVEQDIEINIEILLTSRIVKLEILKDLPKSLLESNWDQVKIKLTANFFTYTQNL